MIRVLAIVLVAALAACSDNRQVMLDALDHMPNGPTGIAELRNKVASGQTSNFTLPEEIRLGVALSRLDTPESLELLAEIKAQHPDAT